MSDSESFEQPDLINAEGLAELEELNKMQASKGVDELYEKEGFGEDDFDEDDEEEGEEMELEEEEAEEGWGQEYKGEGELPTLGAELDGKNHSF